MKSGLSRTSASLIKVPLLAALIGSQIACSSLPSSSPSALDTALDAAPSCAPAPTPQQATPAPHVDIQGQMSLKLSAFGDQPAKGLSLGFFFAGNAQTGQLDLMSLMGSQMAQVNWSPDQVWLTNEGGRQRYASLDELSQAALGEPLPLRTLVYWMQGQPDPSLPSLAGTQPDTFTQSGWTIDAHDLAVKKLHASRPASPLQRAVQIKIYLDR